MLFRNSSIVIYKNGQLINQIYLTTLILASTVIKHHQQTFQRCFNVVFWSIQRRDVGQRQINVETMFCISTLEFTTLNNVESTLCISKLIWTTFDNVEATLSFSTSSFTMFLNVETTLWKWPFLKRTKKIYFELNARNSKFYLLFHNLLHFTPHFILIAKPKKFLKEH